MVVLTLIAIGIVMIYSATAIYAWQNFEDGAFFLKRHLLFLCLGFIFCALSMSIDYRVLAKHAKTFVLCSLLLLVLLHVPGISREIAGAKRWFRIFGFSFQPSEFANLAVILYVASFLSQKGTKRIENFTAGFLPVILVLGAIGLLTLIQPDMGTVIVLSTVVCIMLFNAGVKLRYLLYIGLAVMPALYFLIFSVGYRRQRIVAFLNPWADPLGSGFQLIQSQVALGSGGLFGRGLGKGLQKLFYLPAGHTDFIFSLIGEELGFFVTLSIVFLFVIFFALGCKIIKCAQDDLGAFLGMGIVSLIALDAIINIGVSIGIFPTKGLPLPFISYGGSALIFDMIGIGLLLNVARSSEDP
jgi:cell division protein FtsW